MAPGRQNYCLLGAGCASTCLAGERADRQHSACGRQAGSGAPQLNCFLMPAFMPEIICDTLRRGGAGLAGGLAGCLPAEPSAGLLPFRLEPWLGAGRATPWCRRLLTDTAGCLRAGTGRAAASLPCQAAPAEEAACPLARGAGVEKPRPPCALLMPNLAFSRSLVFAGLDGEAPAGRRGVSRRPRSCVCVCHQAQSVREWRRASAPLACSQSHPPALASHHAIPAVPCHYPTPGMQ